MLKHCKFIPFTCYPRWGLQKGCSALGKSWTKALPREGTVAWDIAFTPPPPQDLGLAGWAPSHLRRRWTNYNSVNIVQMKKKSLSSWIFNKWAKQPMLNVMWNTYPHILICCSICGFGVHTLEFSLMRLCGLSPRLVVCTMLIFSLCGLWPRGSRFLQHS